MTIKNFPKILIIFFLLIFLFQMIGLIFLLTVPIQTNANNEIKFRPQVPIPGMDKVEGFQGMGDTDEQGAYYKINPLSIGGYIKAIYKYAIGIVGILAAVVLMIGGVIWLTAGGNAGQVTEAKAWIGASLIGLVLALSSYMILTTISPDLVRFKPIVIKKIEKPPAQGCCIINNKAVLMMDQECHKAKGIFEENKIPSELDITKCIKPAGIGAKCITQNQCEGTLFCCIEGIINGVQQGICSSGSKGECCNNQDGRKCKENLTCKLDTMGLNGLPAYFKGKCDDPANLVDECTTQNECDKKLFCDLTEQPKKCKPKKNNDRFCHEDYECFGYCDKSILSSIFDSGGLCATIDSKNCGTIGDICTFKVCCADLYCDPGGLLDVARCKTRTNN